MTKKQVKNLGVYIYSSLKLNTQINHVVKSSVSHLLNLAKKSCLTFKSLEMLSYHQDLITVIR